MNDDVYLGQIFIGMDDVPELGIFRGSVCLAIEITQSDDADDPNISLLVMAPGQYEDASKFLSSDRLYPFWLTAMEVCKTGDVSPDQSLILLTTEMNSPHRAGAFDIFYVEDGSDYPLRMNADQPALLFMGQDQVALSDIDYLLKEKHLVMASVDPHWLLSTPPDELYDLALEMTMREMLADLLKNKPKPQLR